MLIAGCDFKRTFAKGNTGQLYRCRQNVISIFIFPLQHYFARRLPTLLNTLIKKLKIAQDTLDMAMKKDTTGFTPDWEKDRISDCLGIGSTSNTKNYIQYVKYLM